MDEEPLEWGVDAVGSPVECIDSLDPRVRRLLGDCVLACTYFGGNCRDCVYNCARGSGPRLSRGFEECMDFCRRRYEECGRYCADLGFRGECMDFCQVNRAECFNQCLREYGGVESRG